jgi:acetoin utilization deacetylase AcuC-like enzyme
MSAGGFNPTGFLLDYSPGGSQSSACLQRRQMVHVYYSPAYVGSGYAFDTTRKAQWIAESLSASGIAGIKLVEPAPLTRDQVIKVHDADYVRAIETGAPRDLADSQGFTWDAGLWPMVLSSNGGVVAAARFALERGVAGSLSSGLHHARYRKGLGFCTFNGLVIAACEAISAAAKSVLVLDLDAHCGGGTASLIAKDERLWQIDVSVSPYDAYPTSDRLRLDVVEDADDYLPTIERRLSEADRLGLDFDLCLYNAGMDPFEDCSIGGKAGITREVLAQRERLVFEWCSRRRLPIAFVIAGGYVSRRLDQQALVELHRLTLTQAAKISAFNCDA